jgi:integrase
MFSAAAKDPKSPFAGMTNPAKGVGVLGKGPSKKDGSDRVYTSQQVRTILATAERTKFGMKRHPEIFWMLRLLAFTGARPNEIAMLQGGDVMEQDGIKFLRIQNADAVTGKLHPQKSVKTGEARTVPLHHLLVCDTAGAAGEAQRSIERSASADRFNTSGHGRKSRRRQRAAQPR